MGLVALLVVVFIFLFYPAPAKSDVEPFIPPTVKETVEMYWSDDPTMIWIIGAESNFKQYAKNPNSSASGLGQIINSTFKTNCKGDVFNVWDNLTCTRILRDKYGYSQWVVYTK